MNLERNQRRKEEKTAKARLVKEGRAAHKAPERRRELNRMKLHTRDRVIRQRARSKIANPERKPRLAKSDYWVSELRRKKWR